MVRLLSLLLLFPSLVVSAQSISHVEPPNWWVGMQLDDVQLMIYGDDLRGAHATFDDPRLNVTAVHFLESPDYAFVDITIPADLPPATYTLTLTRGDDRLSVPFPILAREPVEGRHQGFNKKDVVYLITPDRFANALPENDRVEGLFDDFDPSQHRTRHGGDLEGIIQRLDYLADLGITALWLNPILENNIKNSYHGYHTTDYYKIDPRYGSNDDYKRLVEESHKRGIKIIFDHVNNHMGVTHPWIANLPADSWLNGTPDDHLLGKHFKYAPTDPYADPLEEEALRSFWFTSNMPDINQRDPFLATYLIQNSIWWIEYTGLDGIREDTYPYPDQAFLADWAEAILTEYPRFNIVGEMWEDSPGVLAMYQRESHLPRNFETNLPSIMDFALTSAMRNYLDGSGQLSDVYKVLAQDFLYTDTDNLLTFFDNHDMTRAIYHAEGDAQKVKQMMALLLTTRGIPQLLYATEINMMGGQSHVELRADFPGGFPGHTRDAFTDAGRTAEERDMFNYLRRLLHLRKQYDALTDGKLIHYAVMPWERDVYRYLRILDDERILVLINGEDEATVAELDFPSRWFLPGNRFKDLLTDEVLTIDPSQGLELAPRSARILIALP